MTWKRYTHDEMHELLIRRCLSQTYHEKHAEPFEFIAAQALFCPYYAEITGPLAADWGVILNPNSPRFGLATFEHDHCGCPEADHGGQAGDQSGVDWLRPKRERDRWRRLLCGLDEED